MSRLIDADKLKETLLKFNYTTAHNQIFRYIDQQPTAYDVDKVVEQLEKLKDTFVKVGSYNVATGLDKAINIAKKGGVE